MRPLFLSAFLCLLAACGPGTDSAPPEAPADTARVAALPTSQLPEDAEGALVVYSGRDAGVVGPLVARFREQTGVDVEVRYADDAALLAALAADGDRSPADVLWAEAPGALGVAVERNLFTILPDSMRVLPGAYAPASGLWVPLSTRFRVLAYAPARVDKASLPTSVMSLPEAEPLAGRLGWAPASASFQDFVTAVRVQGGDEPAREWLRAMQASGAKPYPSDAALVRALLAGEIDAALTDHADVLRAAASGITFHPFAPRDPGNLGVSSGAGVLDTSSRQRAARRFVSFLLSPDAQTALADSTREVPVAAGARGPSGYLALPDAAALAPRLDLERLRERDATQALLREVGVL